MPRTLHEIQEMAKQDYSIGLTAHYIPLANFINEYNYKTGVEIGTAYAGNAVHLLANTRLEKFYTVDPFITTGEYNAMPGLKGFDYEMLFMFAYHRLSIYGNCNLLRCTSKKLFEVLKEDQDKQTAKIEFDFFFLDGDHSYETVLYECGEAVKYIRKGGALIGHDYNIFESVNEAVQQFAIETGKEIHLLPGNIWYILL